MAAAAARAAAWALVLAAATDRAAARALVWVAAGAWTLAAAQEATTALAAAWVRSRAAACAVARVLAEGCLRDLVDSSEITEVLQGSKKTKGDRGTGAQWNKGRSRHKGAMEQKTVEGRGAAARERVPAEHIWVQMLSRGERTYR
jgi:hypothetical protein